MIPRFNPKKELNLAACGTVYVKAKPELIALMTNGTVADGMENLLMQSDVVESSFDVSISLQRIDGRFPNILRRPNEYPNTFDLNSTPRRDCFRFPPGAANWGTAMVALVAAIINRSTVEDLKWRWTTQWRLGRESIRKHTPVLDTVASALYFGALAGETLAQCLGVDILAHGPYATGRAFNYEKVTPLQMLKELRGHLYSDRPVHAAVTRYIDELESKLV
jgi:hypothetical protein